MPSGDEPTPSGSAASTESDVFAILEEEAELTAPVVEVSTRREVTVREAPAIVEVFGREDLEQQGVRTLAEALAYSTHFLLVRGANGDASVAVRGFGSENGISVLLDGVPLLDTSTGQFAHYDMPISLIKRIEILRGPGSALFGGNAQAAVINLVTQDDKEPRAHEVQAAVGSGPQVRANAATRVRLFDALHLQLGAAAHADESNALPVSLDGVALRGDLAVPHQSLADPANLAFSRTRSERATRVVLHSGLRFDVGFYLRSRAFIRELQPLYGPAIGGGRGASALPPLGYERQDLELINELGWKGLLFEGAELAVSARHVVNQRRQAGRLTGPLLLNKDRNVDQLADVFPSGLEERLRYRDHVVGLDAQLALDLPLENHLLVGLTGSYAFLEGLNYSANFTNASSRTTSPGFAPTPSGGMELGNNQLFLLGGAQRRSIAFFAQDVFSLIPWIDVVAGLRLDLIQDVGIVTNAQIRADELCAASPFGDCKPRGFAELRRNGKGYVQLSPRLAVVVKPPVLGMKIKLMYGQAFTPPPLGSLTNQTAAENRAGQTYANPLLLPMSSHTVDAEVSIEPWRRHVFGIGYFMVRTEDEVVYDARLQAFLNNAEREVHGGEFTASGYQVIKDGTLVLRYRAGAGFSQTKAVGGQLLGVGANVYPALLANGALSAEVFERLQLMLAVRGQSSSRREAGDTRAPIAARAYVDAQVSLRNLFGLGITAGVIARNIGDVLERSVTTQFQGIVGDIPSGGRSVLGFLQWSFDERGASEKRGEGSHR